VLGVAIFGTLAVCAVALIGAVYLAPEAPLDDPYADDVDGGRLAIEAGPGDAKADGVHRWDDVDTHWGETQWMMQVGA
jgi:hypothetical protein